MLEQGWEKKIGEEFSNIIVWISSNIDNILSKCVYYNILMLRVEWQVWHQIGNTSGTFVSIWHVRWRV